MNDNSAGKRVLLAVLAHPDDETFGMGGTLAYYASQGVSTHLICATRGELGEMDADCLDGFDSVAERRESELRCAAKILGLEGVHFLNYRDSGMEGSPENKHPQALAAQPVEKVAAEIVRYIRELRPQVVITFDPVGGYFHPDHIAMHKATVQAFYAAGDQHFPAGGLTPFQPDKLYFQTISRTFLRIGVRVLKLLGRNPHKFGRNEDIDLVTIAQVDFPTHAAIDYRSVSKIRDQASLCHASQGGGDMAGGLQGWLRKVFSPTETYMRAFPPPADGVIEKDLFEGIKK
jgi:N-acetyl-1-D-myo-inositol-2-amino-2-deoxy-alpha-D-glucopyranoside deacetylase